MKPEQVGPLYAGVRGHRWPTGGQNKQTCMEVQGEDRCFQIYRCHSGKMHSAQNSLLTLFSFVITGCSSLLQLAQDSSDFTRGECIFKLDVITILKNPFPPFPPARVSLSKSNVALGSVADMDLMVNKV